MVDFELLLTVATWYLKDPARATLGVTPRQVPLTGVHAKWLQSHRTGVQAITGVAVLGLLPNHPARIRFTYLDPTYLATGARIHGSATVGDRFTPAYLPRVVVISENKDTAVHFPPSQEASPSKVSARVERPWRRSPGSKTPMVVYWGDIDRDGYEILEGYRTDFDRDIDSILMDPDTYDTYEEFGTDLDQNGKALEAGTPRELENLRADERTMYLRVLDAQHTGHRRI